VEGMEAGRETLRVLLKICCWRVCSAAFSSAHLCNIFRSGIARKYLCRLFGWCTSGRSDPNTADMKCGLVQDNAQPFLLYMVVRRPLFHAVFIWYWSPSTPPPPHSNLSLVVPSHLNNSKTSLS
jgi:hypothetical protein